MKKMIWQSFAALLGLLLTLLVAGCGQKEAPEVSMESFCKALLQEDKDSMKKFDINEGEIKKTFIDEFVPSFNQASAGLFSDEQARQIGTAFFDALKKCNVKAKTLKKDGDKATVELTINTLDTKSFDVDTISTKVMQEAGADASPQVLMDAFIKHFIKAINDFKTGGTKTFEVECTYNSDKGVWLPNDVAKSVEKILETAAGDLM